MTCPEGVIARSAGAIAASSALPADDEGRGMAAGRTSLGAVTRKAVAYEGAGAGAGG